jgi:Restriction endonuclease
MNFTLTAEQLWQREFARLSDTVTPRIEALRSMTPHGFRNEIALMLERLGHTITTTTPDLVTMKAGRKYVTHCANPLDAAPTKSPAIARLHAAVVAANAAGGFYVTARSFTPDAEHYAATLPLITLVDGELLNRSMQRSLKGVTLPQTYRAMCCECGEIVQHRLDHGKALPCPNGHLVPATIARASLVKPRPPQPAEPATADTKPNRAPKLIRFRNMHPKAQIKRRMRAHNSHVARARQQHDSG